MKKIVQSNIIVLTLLLLHYIDLLISIPVTIATVFYCVFIPGPNFHINPLRKGLCAKGWNPFLKFSSLTKINTRELSSTLLSSVFRISVEKLDCLSLSSLGISMILLFPGSTVNS